MAYEDEIVGTSLFYKPYSKPITTATLQPVDNRELEETLCRLPAIDAVRVISDGERVAEVHVLASPAKAAKQVVRDIQSLAMARYGIGIDRRTISVVQITPEDRNAELERPAIAGIIERPTGSTTEATVNLSWQGNLYEGMAVGPAATSARLRLIGEATLRALEQALGGDQMMQLDSVGVAAVGTRPVMIAQVVSMNGTTEEVAVGSSLVRGDDAEAAVRAVLDAMNRRIPSLRR